MIHYHNQLKEILLNILFLDILKLKDDLFLLNEMIFMGHTISIYGMHGGPLFAFCALYPAAIPASTTSKYRGLTFT